ncbi:Longitudinals lacking protein, isoforms A/B/D/L [Harpegnathos saltator]|uniref:Longitudinals lacking protein, isoforms A/B/D/L n=1 Tax=Harpegnathos saltator TaxID=610380 RepID=E2BJA1_HARSA|nr:Longitudinals lacking protein, isoforms A/B/D/L [Harpegnathos saltator]
MIKNFNLPAGIAFSVVCDVRKKQRTCRRAAVDSGNFPAERPKFPCPTCSSVFSHKNNLYYHSKFECGQLPRFNCPYCHYRTKHVSNVRAHVRRKHPGNELSPMRLNQQRDYNWLDVSRSAVLMSSAAAGQHVVSRFPCGNCSSVFSMKHNLQYHLRVECGQSPRFNCPYCVYRTRHPSNVRAHVRRIHPGNHVYVVDICKTEIQQFS